MGDATKTPWKLEWHQDRLFVTGGDDIGSIVCEIRLHDRAEAFANAELIVVAVNDFGKGIQK